jgi:hypothetical protein
MRPASRALTILLFVTALLFLPLVLNGEFIWDDTQLVLRNELTHSFSNLGKMFSEDLWAATPNGAGDFFYYRPLMLLSLTVDNTLGFGSIGHHLHSLAWHLLCVVLLFRLCLNNTDYESTTDEGLTKKAAWSLLAGVSLFALHPLQSEAIAHIAARNDAMACAGILGALLLLSDADPEPRSLWGAGACISLSVFSKETALLAPLMLVAFDQARFGGPQNPRRYGAVLLPIGLALGLRLSLGGAGLPLPTGLDAARDLVAGTGFYVGALVFPWNLTPAVSTQEMQLALLPMVVGGGLLFWLWRKTSSFGRAGLGLAFLGFLPAIPGLVLTENTGFRYMYLPLAGLAMALSGVLHKSHRGLTIAVPALLFALTAKQLSHWQSDTALWQQAYTSAPGLQSACGMFKATEAKALAPAPGPQREALFLSAEPWLAKSLESPTNPYCCFSASRWMWERNQNEWDLMKPQPAITWGRLALRNGCEKSAELLVPLAISEAITGKWDQAEERVRNLKRNPYGLRPVLLSAAGLRRNDPSPLESFAQGDPKAENQLKKAVQLLLDASLALRAP